MKRWQFRLLLVFYVLVVACGMATGDSKELIVPAQVLAEERAAIEDHVGITPMFMSVFVAVTVCTIGGLIGLFFCWRPARILFTSGILGKSILSPIIAPWIVSTGWGRTFGEMELLLDGALCVLVMWGPARHLFEKDTAPLATGDALRAASLEGPSAARILWGVALVLAIPALRYSLLFAQGYLLVPYGWMILVIFPLLTLGTIFVAMVAPVIFMPVRGGPRFLTGVLVFVAVAFLCLWPAGAIVYSHGFEFALTRRADFDRVRAWAIDAIDRYDTGRLETAGDAAYWSPGTKRIADGELPEFLKTGLFAPTKNQWGPEIGICPADGHFKGSGTCIAISWYLHGVLVGKADYATEWNPWYRKQLIPGAYSYHGEK